MVYPRRERMAGEGSVCQYLDRLGGLLLQILCLGPWISVSFFSPQVQNPASTHCVCYTDTLELLCSRLIDPIILASDRTNTKQSRLLDCTQFGVSSPLSIRLCNNHRFKRPRCSRLLAAAQTTHATSREKSLLPIDFFYFCSRTTRHWIKILMASSRLRKWNHGSIQESTSI
jgi:hypothetical protein